MTITPRPRDPGLQQERTALSWQRTTFCVLLLALAAMRGGFSRGEMAVVALGGVAAALAVVLMVVSYCRQKQAVMERELTTHASLLIKRLLSIILSLVALSLVLPALLRL
ncbi:DUF202 domain-containing protein [Raoultella ornithinolytica]|uniref:DUF202 domain-containing protein n=1 Tax=Raoultella ornithinolytica TaxID=54291 RepID=UPI000B5A4B4E|nr:DUF202 domain-containing protein [Raoultella ornithinolytica]KAB8153786.1 DUF202 domain-containing protein [Raoultella ornithinolytica]KAB8163119.1 DUF202 domain-containing protein [Raoultella ornithinolytica]MCT4741425.1 DUF202 domain-containing protein [Raoultella ornithinolytica]MCW9582205.1 DUF202 domain-containing protein [Raoultella ornithinolytica]MEB5727970.1 DUF202 domain-containing protein [Raoultella ornithinolytica]